MRPTLRRAADELRERLDLTELLTPAPILNAVPESERKPLLWSPTTKWFAAPGWKPPRLPTAAHSARVHAEHARGQERKFALTFERTMSPDEEASYWTRFSHLAASLGRGYGMTRTASL